MTPELRHDVALRFVRRKARIADVVSEGFVLLFTGAPAQAQTSGSWQEACHVTCASLPAPTMRHVLNRRLARRAVASGFGPLTKGRPAPASKTGLTMLKTGLPEV